MNTYFHEMKNIRHDIVYAGGSLFKVEGNFKVTVKGNTRFRNCHTN